MQMMQIRSSFKKFAYLQKMLYICTANLFTMAFLDKPIFMQSWWMDAVSATKQWEEILPDMPCLIRQRKGLKWICMPQQTPVGGLWVNPEDCSLEQAQQIAHNIDQRLRKMNLDYYCQHFPVGSPLTEPLHRLGYKLHQRLTYRIDDVSNIEQVEQTFSTNKKRQLRKAESLHAERGISAEEFYRFHRECLAQRQRQISYSREFLLLLEQKTRCHNQSEIIAIKDTNGDILAAAYMVWDNRYLYYLIPCYLPARRDSGAGARLVKEAIILAHEKGLGFDFEGSMDAGIANHYRQFGGQPAVYYTVEKLYHPYFALALLYNRLKIKKFGL